MTPIASSTPGTGWFLNGLANLQQLEAQTERQLSSGYRVNDASDSPSQTPQLIQLGSTLATVQAYQENLGNVQTEAGTADQAIGSSITLIQSAINIASQGASSTTTAAANQVFAATIQGIQQQVVALANTTVAGRAIFGGNQDQSAPYQYNATSAPTGVDTLTISTANRAIVNPQGDTVYQSLTAQQIFDPVDATGAPTASNTFAALQSLQTALQSNDQTAIASALASLQTASSYLNQQQAYYGAAEQRMTGEQNIAANQVTALQTQIGNIRDTNWAQAATDLATEQTNQSAAMGSEAEMSHKSLFDYLG